MQTAVQFIEEKLDNLLELYTSQWEKVNEVLEQAREMEKDQICWAYLNGQHKEKKEIPSKYYYETYGIKGSDENFKQFSLYEHKETITSADTSTSSQTEILDEEIEKGAYRYDENQVLSDYRNSSTYGDFIEGAKWYREQLKKK